MEYIIERNVPIASRGRGGGAESKYPFAMMEVGDSFVAEKRAISAAHAHARKNPPKRFASRREGERYRIHRIA